jgi:magnesium transporter
MEELKFEIIRKLLGEGDDGGVELLRIIEDTHPADLADVLERLDEEERSRFLSVMPAEIASETLTEVRGESQEEMIRGLDDQTLQELFEEMPDDDATDIVQELSDEEAERVMRVIDHEDRRDIQTLMRYPEETAGGIMTSEFVAIEMDMSAAEAIREIRRQGQEIEFFQVYVIDEKGRFHGTISMRDLVLADPEIHIEEILDTDVVTVPPDMDQEEVARLMGRYNQVSMPVVERDRGRLLGRVTVDDVIDIMEQEATEDIFRLSGVDEEESVETVGVWHSIGSRLPWLCLNLLLIFISAQIIRIYIDVLEKEVILAMFLPIVAGIGGNTATQSLAVTLRRLVLDGQYTSRRGRVLIHESAVALMNGLAISVLIFGIIYVTQHEVKLGLIVSASAWLSMTGAGFIGAMVPIGLRSLGFDPTVSSSVVQNFTDLLGFFLLLALSTMLFLG